ncbi:MAG: hypothetical protein KKA31_02265 [Candidatus Margulisbacteria bacterium]|nr:hypothetical protein [Candidatus Margulisiibacteriota bacterium]
MGAIGIGLTLTPQRVGRFAARTRGVFYAEGAGGRTTPLNPWQAVQAITNFRPLFDRKFTVGSCSVQITNPNPNRFTMTMQIEAEQKTTTWRTLGKKVPYRSRPMEIGAEISLAGLTLILPERRETCGPNLESLTIEGHYSKEISTRSTNGVPTGHYEREDTYYRFTLKPKQITEALIAVLRDAEKS